MTILLVTNTRDLTMDLVVQELSDTGSPFLRLNCDFLGDARPTFSFGEKESEFSFVHKGIVVDASTVRAAYLRRPQLDGVIGAHASDVSYRISEWRALLDGIYSELRGRWLNEPTLMDRAEDKVRQLTLARTLGLDIPRTLVSNDPVRIADFVSRFSSIAKPLRDGHLGGPEGEAVVFTTRLTEISPSDEAAITAVPFIVQEEIAKSADVRVTVVGSEIFATRIDSQADERARVDWRRGEIGSLDHQACDLPQDIGRRCVALVKALGLRFGAIDLILGTDNRFWFLEINPNGQWGWLQIRTGQPIARAIVRELMEIASR